MPPEWPITKACPQDSEPAQAEAAESAAEQAPVANVPGAGCASRACVPVGTPSVVDCDQCRDESRLKVDAAEVALRRLREAIDVLPEGLVLIDSEGRYILWNKRYGEIYNGSADLFAPGVRFEDTLRAGIARGEYPEAVGREEEWLAERLDRLWHSSEPHEQTLANGRRILIDERLTSDGGVIGLRIDITKIRQSEESFRLLFKENPMPMFVCAVEDGHVLAVNDAAMAHYGYSSEEFHARSIIDVQAHVSELPWANESSADERMTKTWKHAKADGALIDVVIYTRPIPYNGQAAMMLAVVDITERTQAEARIAFMAQHDALTGLPNRTALRTRLDEMLATSRRTGQKVAALCIDIDDFQAINDTIGHELGDKLLCYVTKRMRSILRDGDFVARLGGDEFMVLQVDVMRPDQVAMLAKRLMSAIGEPYMIEGHSIVVNASVGIAMAPGDGDTADKLLKNTEMALSRAKNDGRGTYRFFESEMDARAQTRRQLEVNLRAAIERQILEPHYQPLVDLVSGRITGCEALVRWPDPERGWIPPSEFIPVAEDTGLIGMLGVMILRRACHDAAAWPGEARVAVNLSPVQFRTGSLFATVMDALKQSGLPARRLELEITETLILEKSEHVVATLHALRALGVRISMDDFGTGYSSLSYLRSFPFDKIKIDRSFVQDLDSNPGAQAIIRAVAGLGTSLGVTVTAEGIETAAELACLRREGCHEGQGFLFSRARRNDDIRQLMQAQHDAEMALVERRAIAQAG